jgi:hypothetical protein
MSNPEELRKKLLELVNKPIIEENKSLPPVPKDGQEFPPPIPKQKKEFTSPKPETPQQAQPTQINPFITNKDIMDEKDTAKLIEAMTGNKIKEKDYPQYSTNKEKEAVKLLNEIINYQNQTIDKVKNARLSGDPSSMLSINNYHLDKDWIKNDQNFKNLSDYIANKQIRTPGRHAPNRDYLNFGALKPEAEKEIINAINNSDYEKALDLAHTRDNMFGGRQTLNEVVSHILKEKNITQPDELYSLFKNEDLLRKIPIINKKLEDPSIAGQYDRTPTPEYPFGTITINTNKNTPNKLATILHELRHANNTITNSDLSNKLRVSNYPLEIPQSGTILDNPKRVYKGYAHLNKEGSGGLISHHIEPYAEIDTIKGLSKNKLFGLLPVIAAAGLSGYSAGTKADEGDYEGAAKDIGENVADIGSLGAYSGLKKLSNSNILKDISTADRSGEPFEWSNYNKEDIDKMKEGLKDTAHAAAYLTPAAPFVGAMDTGTMLGQGGGMLENLYKGYKANQSIFDPEFEEKEKASKRAQEEWEARQKRESDTDEVGGITRANKIRRSIEAKK